MAVYDVMYERLGDGGEWQRMPDCDPAVGSIYLRTIQARLRPHERAVIIRTDASEPGRVITPTLDYIEYDGE